jgi:uncharacterized protein YndB with AHSA1/START domain
MRKIFTIIFALVVVAVAGVLAIAATKPDEIRVARTARISAPPEKIYPLINDFRQWGAWSPYEKKDPAMKRTFGSVTTGKGATYEWDGDGNVGKGRMEITETTSPSKVVIKLDFIKPFEGHNTAEFAMKPDGQSTDVTWTMHGPAAFITKIMCVFFDMDKMIGPDFEAGLASIKSMAEK